MSMQDHDGIDTQEASLLSSGPLLEMGEGQKQSVTSSNAVIDMSTK